MKKIFLFLFISFHIFARQGVAQQDVARSQKVWLDADTGNEMDDVFAIIRLLWAEDINVVGLSSAHFNNADLVVFDKWNQYTTPGINPVKISQGLNEEILTTMGLQHIPHPMGADRQMGRAWGGYEPRPSNATDELLKVIQSLKPGEKLDILTLGALTNIASLIAMDSTIISKIRVFSLGGGYNFEKNAWNKNEFNVRCDLNAFDFMMNEAEVDWTVMPIHTVITYQFEREEIYQRFQDDKPVEQLMEKRWRETNPQDKIRVMWDLGLVQAYLKPAMAKQREVKTPPENHPHTVKIYSEIDTEKMYADFWKTVEDHRHAFQIPVDKPKLGEIHLGNRVGSTIAQEGAMQQLICMEEDDQLLSLQTCITPNGSIVKSIKLKVKKKEGNVQNFVFGDTTQGVWQPIFEIKQGHSLVGISGASGWFIDSIRFHFDDGSATPLYGGKGGDTAYQLLLAKDEKGELKGRWMGFWGSYTDLLESIGLVFWPIE